MNFFEKMREREEKTMLKDFPKKYMERYYTRTYHMAKAAVYRFNNEELTIKLTEFYLKKIKEEYCYEQSETKRLSNRICKYLNEINHPDIEFYLEYCLEFFEKDFLSFLYIIYLISMKTNLVLKEICHNYLRYCGRKDKEILLENIFKYIPTSINENSELTQILNNIMDIEKKHILNCYELAKNGETFCENCMPKCWVEKNENEKGYPKALYKRTTPFRW